LSNLLMEKIGTTRCSKFVCNRHLSQYDKNGSLTYDGQYTYIYDCENRLLEVKQEEITIEK
jgi:hypothetical protein